MDDCRTSKEIALAELEKIAPGSPFLALGQTVFWDEPMKAGVHLTSKALAYDRAFVAGIHDTDYFAKLPAGKGEGRYKAVVHNDTTTKGLWSAAGEFSRLFGSETVITRDQLQAAGLKLSKIARAREGILAEVTEAWGWRGVVWLGNEAKITAEVGIGPLFRELSGTLEWAIEGTLDSILKDHRAGSENAADTLRTMVCDAAEDRTISLAQHYEKLLPDIYRFVASAPVDVVTSRTTQLLRFTTDTCKLPRFDLPRMFVEPETRELARKSYDEAIFGTEIYPLDRFGSGAIPFDLIVPGHGRGTVRLGTRAIIIMTPHPMFITLKKPLKTLDDLAAAIEKKLGTNCTLVGKAVTLIGMFAREFVFVFHEGASSYVKYSRVLHDRLAEAGCRLNVNPILRVRYDAWDSLSASCSWFSLPEPLRRPFGLEELCGPSFSSRWRDVAEEQSAILKRLGQLRSPLELIRYFAETSAESWRNLAVEYEAIHKGLEDLNRKISELRKEKAAHVREIKLAKKERVDLERQMGEHWRSNIFEKSPTAADWVRREELKAAIIGQQHEIARQRGLWSALQSKQDALVKSQEVLSAHERRRNIELELELKRVSLIRDAIVSSDGLMKSNNRPSAWWMPVVCPDGAWFKKTIEASRYRLEPLIG